MTSGAAGGGMVSALVVLALCGQLTSAAAARWPFQSLGILRPIDFQQRSLEQIILDEFSTSTRQWKPQPPEVKSLHISSEIANRYAHTLITSRVANPANVSQEVHFTVIIPETAFISGFAMEIDGKVYTAYVKEKEEAQREYTAAVNRGQAAAHVHQSARDSERFSVSVNVEAQSKVTFNLTYEELLQRDQGIYRHVINLNPGQIVAEMVIDIHIKELRDIRNLRANEIQSANEIDTNIAENPKAQVEFINPKEARIHYEADEKEQRRIEKLNKGGENKEGKGGESKEGKGVAGQFVIEYDVDRDPSGGQVIVNDGYFVHFFAPNELRPLRKHVLFVLDVSGSMSGRKIEQLKQAMTAILDELHPHDMFNIIEFSYSVTVRNLDAEVKSLVYQPYVPYTFNHHTDYVVELPQTVENTQPFPATPHYIRKAKAIVEKMTAGGGTNIYDALKTAIEIAKRGISLKASKPDIRTEPLPLVTKDKDSIGAPEDSNKKPAKAFEDKDSLAEPDEPGASDITKESPAKTFEVKDGVGAPDQTMVDKQTSGITDKEPPQPIIIFLTDGEPTVGETRLHKIQTAVNEFNSPPKATIFSLAFGEGADFPFLKRVALANNGFARHIYEAADAEAQLRNFYNQISSPLLANVRFVYPPDQVDDDTVTKRVFSTLFSGSELVIAGRARPGVKDVQDFSGAQVEALSLEGPKRFRIPLPELRPISQPHKMGSLERLWAYLTIRQLLDQQEIESATTPQYRVYPDPTNPADPLKIRKQTPKEKALQLALKAVWEEVLSVMATLVAWLELSVEFLRSLFTDSYALIYVDSEATQRGPVSPRERALQLALKYSFVCPLTSLVVVKPNGTSDLSTESANPAMEDGPSALPFQQASYSYSGRVGGGSNGYVQRAAMMMSVPRVRDSSRLQLPDPANILFKRPSHQLLASPPGPHPPGFAAAKPLALAPLPTTLNVPTIFDRVDFDINKEQAAEMEEDALSALSAIPWLPSVRQGDALLLPLPNGTTITLQLSAPSVNSSSGSWCSVGGVEGVCLPLQLCVADVMKTTLDEYVTSYMCRLPGDVAGSCCVSAVTTEPLQTTTEVVTTETPGEETTTATEELSSIISTTDITSDTTIATTVE